MSALAVRQLPVPADSPLLLLDCDFRQAFAAKVEDRDYSVFLTRDRITDGEEPRWHLSIAGRGEVPSWADLVAIAHELRPGIVFVVGVPPRSWWLNVHEHCLHLWELRDAQLIGQWRREARGDAPS